MGDYKQRLVETWALELGSVMEMMGAPAPKATVSSGETENFDLLGNGFWAQQPFSHHPKAVAWIYLPEKTWRGVGEVVAQATGIEDADEDTIKTTCLEVVGQAFSGLATKLSAEGLAIATLGINAAASAPEEQTEAAMVSLQMEGRGSLRLGLALSATLISDIEPGDERIGSERAQRPGGAGSAKVAEMDLIYQIELPLSISFGRTYMPLREVLKLTTGSIVELDRLITEPVDIVVNNCVVARGDVVVIDGNYGVRITDVVDRNDRLALRNPGRPVAPYSEFRIKQGA